MGGDHSQKLLPRRGRYSSPGRKPPAHCEFNTVAETTVGICSLPPPGQSGQCLCYRPPGSFLESTVGSVLARAEVDALTHAKSVLISPPDVAIEHLFPPYTNEKVQALSQWFEY